MSLKSWFSQSTYPCRLEWGRRGAREAAARGDLVVIVDVLRFSTAVVAAVEQGARIYPCSSPEDAPALASRVVAEIAGKGHRFSLSPHSYDGVEPDTRIVLPSPNGATCVTLARSSPRVLVAALINAEATARAILEALDSSVGEVTVVACGERWPDSSEDGELRFAIEDYLGAGAILSHLPLPKSPEALAAEGAFLHLRSKLDEVLLQSGSGIELCDKGHKADVTFAARLNSHQSVPTLCGDYFYSGEDEPRMDANGRE